VFTTRIGIKTRVNMFEPAVWCCSPMLFRSMVFSGEWAEQR